MSIRGRMLTSAGRAKTILADSSDIVAEFLNTHLNDDGGFADRNGTSDLYYTVFGIESFIALGAEFEREKILGFLRGFGSGKNLDFIHSACLARSLANLTDRIDEDVRRILLDNIESCRCEDAGYSHTGGETGSIYGCFFALCCYQDLGMEVPNSQAFLSFVESLRQADGGYANESELKLSLTPATSAALMILNCFKKSISDTTVSWLLEKCFKEGGFCVSPVLSMPDLLSTATAIHALCVNGVDIGGVRNRCLDFVKSLRSSEGGFCGSVADTEPDCEYTYYGLLALGNLAGD